MSVHDLPSAIFGPEDARDAQSHGANILTPANLGPVALHLHNISKIGGCILRHVLEAHDLAIPVVGCGPLHGPSGLIPSAHGRAERVGKAYVSSMGVHLLEGLWVAIDDLAQREVRSLEHLVKLVYGSHLEITSVVEAGSFPSAPCHHPTLFTRVRRSRILRSSAILAALLHWAQPLRWRA